MIIKYSVGVLNPSNIIWDYSFLAKIWSAIFIFPILNTTHLYDQAWNEDPVKIRPKLTEDYDLFIPWSLVRKLTW